MYMENQEQSQSMGTKQYYILGFIVLIAIVGAGYLLRGKSTPATTQTPVANIAAPTPTPGPITGLGCDTQYYNPVVGFPKYYLSVEGGDLSTAKKVDCTFTVTIDKKVVVTETASSPLTDKPQRGGSTFRCTTPAIDIAPNMPAVVDVILKDDLKASSTCSSTFLFPAP
jgi:hypothetical protein